MEEPKARAAPDRKERRKHVRKPLTPQKVAYLGTQLAMTLGFLPRSVSQVTRTLKRATLTPMIRRNGTYRLWIDPDYIAVERLDDYTLTYVYVTHCHISRELRDDFTARKRGDGFIEPATRAQFAAAWRAMKEGESQSALRASSRDSGLCGANAALDLEAPWQPA